MAARQPDDRPKFTVRFGDPALHSSLQTTAKALGCSMNDLVQRYVGRELRIDMIGLEMDLERTLTLLRSYRGPTRDELSTSAVAYGRAEGDFDDPLRAVMADEPELAEANAPQSRRSVRSRFAHTVER
jgi:hypothetical protein